VSGLRHAQRSARRLRDGVRVHGRARLAIVRTIVDNREYDST